MSSKSYTATFPGRFSSLKYIADFVHKAAAEVGLNRSATYKVETAVDEACSNIIEHAYGGENIGVIVCSCILETDRLTIELKDTGKPFDPNSIPQPDTSASLDERKGNGLGLYFMQQMMDEIHFHFDPETGNHLKMVKYKREEET